MNERILSDAGDKVKNHLYNTDHETHRQTGSYTYTPRREKGTCVFPYEIEYFTEFEAGCKSPFAGEDDENGGINNRKK